MTKTQFRSWVETQVDTWRAANYPTLPVFYENGENPDQGKVGALWLDVEIGYRGGVAAAVGGRAPARLSGNVRLMAYMKQGGGMQAGEAVLDSLLDHFRTNRRAAGGVMLDVPVPHSAPPMLGWQKAGWLVPFKVDVA